MRRHLTERLSDAAVAPFAGTFVDAAACAVIRDATTVLKPNGDLLLTYLPDALSSEECEIARSTFGLMDVWSENRGLAAGPVSPDSVPVDSVIEGTRYRRRRVDGRLSETRMSSRVRSGVVGFADRNVRTPYCRQTALTQHSSPKVVQALPLLRGLSRIYADSAPMFYRLQHDAAAHTHPDFVIAGTCFTTVTVNRDFRTALHRDEGDLRDGLGVLAAFDLDTFTGGELVFPAYKVAVDLRPGGVLLADVHEFHGNAPICGTGRLSLVAYFREGMLACRSAAEELARAKALR